MPRRNLSVPAVRSDWAEHAHRSLRSTGLKVGPARERVILELAARGRSTAQGLAAHLAEGSDRIAVSSVYRSLIALVEAGALHPVELGGVTHFELVGLTEGGGRYLVCVDCGRTTTFESVAADEAITGSAQELGFDVWGHDIVVKGRCTACARAAAGLSEAAQTS
ncbi:MAG: transcriptional repressor [Herbiconiux sp.]|nr:transcriptional repressor [Herbiconiux sp.]